MVQNFDVRIQIVHPLLTKSLNKQDKSTLKATGSFKFDPRPQVDVATSSLLQENFVPAEEPSDRVENLKTDLSSIFSDLEKIEEAIKKRAGHITLEYDPEVAENESLANAEEVIYGNASGSITYERYKSTIDFMSRVDKFISHQNVENRGVLSGAA